MHVPPAAPWHSRVRAPRDRPRPWAVGILLRVLVWHIIVTRLTGVNDDTQQNTLLFSCGVCLTIIVQKNPRPGILSCQGEETCVIQWRARLHITTPSRPSVKVSQSMVRLYACTALLILDYGTWTRDPAAIPCPCTIPTATASQTDNIADWLATLGQKTVQRLTEKDGEITRENLLVFWYRWTA